MNCLYFGVMAGKPVGSTISCPLCAASVETVRRNGYAYAPPHEPHEPHHHVKTYNHTKGKVARGTY